MPNSPQLNNVLSLVRKLTPEERRSVINAIRMQDGAAPSAAELPRHAEDWLLPGIEVAMRREGILVGNLSADKLSNWAPHYAKHSAEIRKQLEPRLKANPNRNELAAFGRMCGKALVDYARNTTNSPMGPRGVLAAVPDLAAALEHSFPGYLQAGILRKIIRV